MIKNTAIMALPQLHVKYKVGKRQRCNFVPVTKVEIGGSIQIHLSRSGWEEYEQESQERAQSCPKSGKIVLKWSGQS